MLLPLAAETQRIYERNAARFDRERAKNLFERKWVDRFLKEIPAKGRILDVGCGSAEPIAAHMISRGFQVTGMDASAAMLDIARARYPGGDWRHCDMRAIQFEDQFDGIIAWNSFFHLTRDDQRAVLPVFANRLASNGVLMLTVGPEDSEVDGHVGDDRVYHASLSPGEYRERLAACGVTVLDFVAEDPDCDFHSILLAQKQE